MMQLPEKVQQIKFAECDQRTCSLTQLHSFKSLCDHAIIKDWFESTVIAFLSQVYHGLSDLPWS